MFYLQTSVLTPSHGLPDPYGLQESECLGKTTFGCGGELAVIRMYGKRFYCTWRRQYSHQAKGCLILTAFKQVNV